MKKPLFLKITAVLTALFIALDPGSSYASTPRIDSAAPLKIPADLGREEESFRGLSSKTILYIQDAHDSFEAQKNIASLVTHLTEKSGVKTVFEEGYQGPVPTDKFFGFIEDGEDRLKVSSFLLDKLRIGGAEYAHINRKTDFSLIGADHLEHYRQNIQAFRDAAEKNADIEKDLTAILTEIESLVHQKFPKPLREWLDTRDRYEKGQLDLLEYAERGWKILEAQTEGSAAKNALPVISILLAAKNTPDEAIAAKARAIEPQELFREITALDKAIAALFTRAEKETLLLHYRSALHLLKRLNQIEVSPAEYAASKEILSGLNTRELADFIARESKKSLVLSKAWEENIKTASRFYELAHQRDDAIEQTLKNYLSSTDENTAVLVYGGFHKAGILSILRRLGVSYRVITPHISGTDPVHENYYKQLMAEGVHEYEKSILSPKGLASTATRPPSLFVETFGEASVQALYKAVSQKPGTPAELLGQALRESRSEMRMVSSFEMELAFGELAKSPVLSGGRNDDFLYENGKKVAVIMPWSKFIYRALDPDGREIPDRIYKITHYTSENETLFEEAKKIFALQIPGVSKLQRVGMLKNGGMWMELKGIASARSMDREVFGRTPRLFNVLIRAGELLKGIHERGVVHGDIKPENLLINSAQELEWIDFGGNFTRGYVALDDNKKPLSDSASPDVDVYSFIMIIAHLLDHQIQAQSPEIALILRRMRDEYLHLILKDWTFQRFEELLQIGVWTDKLTPLPRKKWPKDMSEIIEKLKRDLQELTETHPELFKTAIEEEKKLIHASVHSMENRDTAQKLKQLLDTLQREGALHRGKIAVTDLSRGAVAPAFEEQIEAFSNQQEINIVMEGAYLDDCCRQASWTLLDYARKNPGKNLNLHFPVDLIAYPHDFLAESDSREKISSLLFNLESDAAGLPYEIFVDGVKAQTSGGETPSEEPVRVKLYLWSDSLLMAQTVTESLRSELRRPDESPSIIQNLFFEPDITPETFAAAEALIPTPILDRLIREGYELPTGFKTRSLPDANKKLILSIQKGGGFLEIILKDAANPSHEFLKIPLSVKGKHLGLGFGHLNQFSEAKAAYSSYSDPVFAWWFLKNLVPFAKQTGFDDFDLIQGPLSDADLRKLGFKMRDEATGVPFWIYPLAAPSLSADQGLQKWLREAPALFTRPGVGSIIALPPAGQDFDSDPSLNQEILRSLTRRLAEIHLSAFEGNQPEENNPEQWLKHLSNPERRILVQINSSGIIEGHLLSENWDLSAKSIALKEMAVVGSELLKKKGSLLLDIFLKQVYNASKAEEITWLSYFAFIPLYERYLKNRSILYEFDGWTGFTVPVSGLAAFSSRLDAERSELRINGDPDEIPLGETRKVTVAAGEKILVSGFDPKRKTSALIEIRSVGKSPGREIGGRLKAPRREAEVRISAPPQIVILRDTEWLEFLTEHENPSADVPLYGRWNFKSLWALQDKLLARTFGRRFMSWRATLPEDRKVHLFDLVTKARIEVEIIKADISQNNAELTLRPVSIPGHRETFFVQSLSSPGPAIPEPALENTASRQELRGTELSTAEMSEIKQHTRTAANEFDFKFEFTDFEILGKTHDPSFDPALTSYLVKVNALSPALKEMERTFLIGINQNHELAAAAWVLSLSEDKKIFQAGKTKSFIAKERWMQRTLPLALKSRLINVWWSAPEENRSGDAEKMYERLMTDPLFSIEYVQDQLKVTLADSPTLQMSSSQDSRNEDTNSRAELRSDLTERLTEILEWEETAPFAVSIKGALYFLSDSTPAMQKEGLLAIAPLRPFDYKLDQAARRLAASLESRTGFSGTVSGAMIKQAEKINRDLANAQAEVTAFFDRHENRRTYAPGQRPVRGTIVAEEDLPRPGVFTRDQFHELEDLLITQRRPVPEREEIMELLAQIHALDLDNNKFKQFIFLQVRKALQETPRHFSLLVRLDKFLIKKNLIRLWLENLYPPEKLDAAFEEVKAAGVDISRTQFDERLYDVSLVDPHFLDTLEKKKTEWKPFKVTLQKTLERSASLMDEKVLDAEWQRLERLRTRTESLIWLNQEMRGALSLPDLYAQYKKEKSLLRNQPAEDTAVVDADAMTKALISDKSLFYLAALKAIPKEKISQAPFLMFVRNLLVGYALLNTDLTAQMEKGPLENRREAFGVLARDHAYHLLQMAGLERSDFPALESALQDLFKPFLDELSKSVVHESAGETTYWLVPQGIASIFRGRSNIIDCSFDRDAYKGQAYTRAVHEDTMYYFVYKGEIRPERLKGYVGGLLGKESKGTRKILTLDTINSPSLDGEELLLELFRNLQQEAAEKGAAGIALPKDMRGAFNFDNQDTISKLSLYTTGQKIQVQPQNKAAWDKLTQMFGRDVYNSIESGTFILLPPVPARAELRGSAENFDDPTLLEAYPQLKQISNAWEEFLASSEADRNRFLNAYEGGAFVRSPFQWMSFMKENWNLNAQSRILDVGSGNGLAALAFHILTGAKVTSIEVDPMRWVVLQSFLRFLKERKNLEFPDVRFEQADFLNYPLEDFDFIYFYYTHAVKNTALQGDWIVNRLSEKLPETAVFVSPGFYLFSEYSRMLIMKKDRNSYFAETPLDYSEIILPKGKSLVHTREAAVLTRRQESTFPQKDARSELRASYSEEPGASGLNLAGSLLAPDLFVASSPFTKLLTFKEFFFSTAPQGTRRGLIDDLINGRKTFSPQIQNHFRGPSPANRAFFISGSPTNPASEYSEYEIYKTLAGLLLNMLEEPERQIFSDFYKQNFSSDRQFVKVIRGMGDFRGIVVSESYVNSPSLPAIIRHEQFHMALDDFLKAASKNSALRKDFEDVRKLLPVFVSAGGLESLQASLGKLSSYAGPIEALKKGNFSFTEEFLAQTLYTADAPPGLESAFAVLKNTLARIEAENPDFRAGMQVLRRLQPSSDAKAAEKNALLNDFTKQMKPGKQTSPEPEPSAEEALASFSSESLRDLYVKAPQNFISNLTLRLQQHFTRAGMAGGALSVGNLIIIQITEGASIRSASLEITAPVEFDQLSQKTREFLTSRSELRTETPAQLLGFDRSTPLWDFLSAFGIDSSKAEVETLDGPWGRVTAAQHEAFGVEAGSDLREAVLESAYAVFDSRETRERLKEQSIPEDKAVDFLYLLTFEKIPVSLVWAIPGEPFQPLFYYPLAGPGLEPLWKGSSPEARTSISSPPLPQDLEFFIRAHHKKDFGKNPVLQGGLPLSMQRYGLPGGALREFEEGVAFPTVFSLNHQTSKGLVETAGQLIAAGIFSIEGETVSEVGTGAGWIAAQMALRGAAEVHAYDLNLMKAANAAQTARRHGVAGRFHAYRARSAKVLPSSRLYLWNIPDFADSAAGVLDQRILDQSESIAVNNRIPVESVRRVFQELSAKARPDSLFLVRTHPWDEPAFFEMLKNSGWEMHPSSEKEIQNPGRGGSFFLLRPELEKEAAARRAGEDALSRDFRGTPETLEALRAVAQDLQPDQHGFPVLLIEGLPGSGKSSRAEDLKAVLKSQGRKAVVIHSELYLLQGRYNKPIRAFFGLLTRWIARQPNENLFDYAARAFVDTARVERWISDINSLRAEGGLLTIDRDQKIQEKLTPDTVLIIEGTLSSHLFRKLSGAKRLFLDVPVKTIRHQFVKRTLFEAAGGVAYGSFKARLMAPGIAVGFFRRHAARFDFILKTQSSGAVSLIRPRIAGAMRGPAQTPGVPSRSELRNTHPLDLTPEEKNLILESARSGFHRQGAVDETTPIWFFGEQEVVEPFIAPFFSQTSDKALPSELFQDKKVLVMPGYGNLPFILRAFGAREVVAADRDPATIAWQKLKWKSGVENLNDWLFVSESSRFLIQSAVRQQWLRSLNAPVDPENTFDGMTFQTADILQPLPVTGEKYDLIVVPYLFGFAHGLVTKDQWDKALENLGKVLAPGGRVILAPGKLDLSKLKESDEKTQTENYQIWLNDLERKGWDVSHSKRYSFHHILGFEPVSAGFSILTPRSELRAAAFISPEELDSFFQKVQTVFNQLPADFKHRNELGYEFKTREEVTKHLGGPDDNISAAVSEIYQQRGFMMGSESMEDQVSGKPVHTRTFWIDPSNPNFRFGALLEIIKRGTEVVADVYDQRDTEAARDLIRQMLGAPRKPVPQTMGLAALSSWRALLDETAVMDLRLSSRSELRTSSSQGFGSVNTSSRSELRSDEASSQSPAAEKSSEDSFSRSEAEYSRLIQAIEKMPDSIPTVAEIREFKSYLENEDPQLNTMLRKAMYFYLTAIAEHNGGAYKDKSPRSLYENDKRSWYDLLNNAMQTVSVGLLLTEQLISTAPEKESSQTFFESFLKSAQTMLAMGYMKTQFETNRRADEIEQLFEEQRPKRGATLDPLDKEVPTTFGGPYTLRRIVQHLEVKQGAWFFGPLLYEELGDADRKTVAAALTAETRERLSFFEFIDSAWDEVKPASGQDAGVENLRKRTNFKTLNAALSDIFSFGIRYDAYGVEGVHDFLQIAFEGKVRSPFRGSLTAHPQFASDSAGEHGSFYVIFKHNIQDPFADQRDHHRWYLVPEQSDKDAISAMAEKAVGKGLLGPEVSADIQSKLVTYQEFIELNLPSPQTPAPQDPGSETAEPRSELRIENLNDYFESAEEVQASPVLAGGNLALKTFETLTQGILLYESLLKSFDTLTGSRFSSSLSEELSALKKQLADSGAQLITQAVFKEGDEAEAAKAVNDLRTGIRNYEKLFNDAGIFTKALTHLQADPELLLSAGTQTLLNDISITRRRIWRAMEHFTLVTEPAAGKPYGIIDPQLRLNSLIREVMAAEGKRFSLYWRFANVDFKPGTIPAINGDTSRLFNAFSEIIRNAVFATVRRDLHNRYSPAGLVEIKTVLSQDDFIEVTITDTGIGISEEVIKLVEYYAYSKSSFDQDIFFGGRGIGIPTAILTFQEHGGTLKIDSAESQGTRVTVRLPVRLSKRSELRASPEPETELKVMRSSMRHFLRRQIEARTIDPKKYEFVSDILPYRILAAKDARGKILGFAFGKKGNRHMHAIVTEKDHEPDGFIYEKDDHGIRIITYVTEGDKNYKEDVFVLGRFGDVYRLRIEESGGHPSQQSIEYHNWMPSYMLTRAQEVEALSRVLGPQLYEGVQSFIPENTRLVLAPGMEPEARMTYWPSVQGSVRSREEVFGGLDHEGFDVAHIRHQDSTQEQLAEGTPIRSLVNEPGRVQWTFEDNVQSTAIVMSGITLPVGSKRMYVPKNPDDMGRVTIGAGGAIQFPEGVEYDVIDTPGEKYRVAFVYTHLALADWVKPGAEIAAGDERTLGTIKKHRRYPYSPVVPHLHFAVMLFKESEIEKYPQLNYEILNRKLGPDQTVLYVNPLSLLDQEQRARLFVEGPEAASGFGSAAIQALNRDSLKSVRARVSHALLGIPVWTAAGPGELTESMLESDTVIRQTDAGWQVRLNGRLSAELPSDQDKTLPDEDALIGHLKSLDLKLRQLREAKSRNELRNFDAEDTLTDSASEIGLSSVWEQAWTVFGKRAFSYENFTHKASFLSKDVFQSRFQDLQKLGLASVDRKQNVSGRPLRVRLTNIHENGPQGTERQRQRELAFLIAQLSRPGDEEILRPQIQRVLSGESLFALPLETDSYEDQEIAAAGQGYDFPGLVIVFRTLKKLFGREYVKAVTLAEMLGKTSDRGRSIRALAEDLEALGIVETLRKGSTGSVWVRLSPKLDDSQLGKIEKALLEASRVKGDPSLSFKIRNILERKSAAADMNQSAVIKPSAKASGLFKLTLPAIVRAIEEEEIEQRRQGESEPSVRLNQIAARLGVSITSFHHSLLAEHTDLRRLGIQGLALGLPVDETIKPEPGKKKPLDGARARPAFETIIREAVSRLRGSDSDFAAIPIRTSVLARELGLSDTGLREPLKKLDLLPLLDALGVFSFKPASPALEEQAGKFLRSLGLEPSEALAALVLGKSGAKRKVDALSPDVKRVQEILDRWQNEQELRRVQRRKDYVQSLQTKAAQHYEAAVSSQSGIEESKKILQVIDPNHPEFSAAEPSIGKSGKRQTEYLVPDENRAAFETNFKIFQTAFLDELTNLKMRTQIDFKKLLAAAAAADRNLAAEEMSLQRWTSFGSFSLEDIFRAGKKTSAFAAFWKAWDAAEGYPPLAEEMTKRLDVLRRFYQHRSELRITDEETLKTELRKNTSLLHWQLTLAAYLPDKGNDQVDITLQIARGIRVRLSAARSLFSDPEFEDAVHRYIAAWIYNLSIVYGTSFAAAGAEEDPSLVDPAKIETLLTMGDLSSIRESLSKGAENPLGIASYANAGRPVRIKRLTELTDEEKEIQPVALQVKLQTQVPGTYLGIDIGGGSAKWAVLQDGKLLDLPKELKSSTTLLMDSASNPVYESPEDYVARLTNRARDILDYLQKTYGIEKVEGVGIDIPGAADFNNNTMVTLGQIPVKKEWNQDQVTWTGREIPRRMAEALGLEPLRVKIRNDMDGVLPGVASVLPAAKKDFWERTGGDFGFDWMGTGHGNQYAVAGVPMNAPTESGHMTFEFGQPGQPLFDTEAYTSIPSMLIYARELVRKTGNGWPEISGDQLKPLADQAFYEGTDALQLKRKAIALKVFERFAEKYAANLALRYVLAESSGFGNASEILLGGGIARGRTGTLLRDLTLKQLRAYGLEQKIRITVIQDDDIRQAGLDPDDVGPAGSAYFIQSLLAPGSPDGEEFEIDPGYLESPASVPNNEAFQSLARRFEGRRLSWIDPAEKAPGARARQAVAAASFKKYVQWKTGAEAAPLLSDYHFTAGPSEEEIRAFPDLKKLIPDDPDLPGRRPLFGSVSGSFFTNETGQRVFLVSIIQTGVNWKLLERATKNRYDPIRGASLRPEGNLYSWYGTLIAALEETLRAEDVHQIAVLSSEGIREIRTVSGVKIGDEIADKMYGKPGLGYETARVKLRDASGGEHELAVWKKELSGETSQRSELRESGSVSNKGTLMISASSLSSLTQKGKDELFSRMYLNRANLRLVIFRDGPALSGQALNALLKLPNVFVTAEKDYAAAARKQAIPGASVILLLGEEESLSSGEKRIKGVLLKNQAGEIEFARLLAFNGGSLPNIPEENGVFNPPADFLSDLNQRILSALVVAYSA